jgi:tetratricopeptide (TPR) repeat protein
MHYSSVTDSTHNTEYFFVLGLQKAKQEDYEGAIANFNLVIQSEPECCQAYHNRGVIYFKLGEIQAAIADFTTTLKINAKYTESYVARGNAYRYLKDYQGAIIDYTKVLQIDPTDAKAYYNRAVTYSDLGEKQKAVRDYQVAIKLFYEQKDDLNGRRAWENLQQLQPSSLFSKPKKQEISTFNRTASDKQEVNRLLLVRVMELLHSDRELAMRLISQVKQKNSNRSMNWCIEKVIYDLERDRGKY